MRIVVVDDEKEIADLVAAVLLAEGYEVDVYYEAQAAFSDMTERPPSLAILDVMMPKMDGFTLCARLREKHTFPILFLTARQSDGDKIAGLAVGPMIILPSPFGRRCWRHGSRRRCGGIPPTERRRVRIG